MALSESRLMLRNVAKTWKTSPRSAIASENGNQATLRCTPPEHFKNKRRLLPSNLLVKFQESCKSSVTRHIQTAVPCEPTKNNNCDCVYENISQPLSKIVKAGKYTGITSEDPSVDTPDREHILMCGLEDGHTRRLGQGGFGTIFQAKYKGDRVAVKLIPLKHSGKRVSLRREANALNLTHPNIVKVLQVICTEQTSNYGIVIMELCYGLNLHSLLEDPFYEVDSLKRINFAIDIASAVQHCHDNRILHLDVKPQNIIVCPLGVCKLCDFGSSCILEDGNSSIYNCQDLGTPIYTDPEILRRQCASKQSDVYSFGITLWQLLSREVPYATCNLHEQTIIYQVVAQELRPRAVLDINKGEKDYVQLYKLCWKQRPSSRPPSMLTVIRKLEWIRLKLEVMAKDRLVQE